MVVPVATEALKAIMVTAMAIRMRQATQAVTITPRTVTIAARATAEVETLEVLRKHLERSQMRMTILEKAQLRTASL